MKYYQMAARILSYSTMIDRSNNRRCKFWSGQPLASVVQLPAEFILDDRFPGGVLPTFYDTPGFIARKSFYQALRDAGVSNIEAFPAVIFDESRSRTITDYVLLNVIGLVACADMLSSEHDNLGDDDTPIVAIDRLVLRAADAAWPDLFLSAEDPQVIIVSGRVHDLLVAGPHDDVYFEELAQSA